MNNFEFIAYSKNDLVDRVFARSNEVRIGQTCHRGLDNEAHYVILGIKEDIGPQTNHGRPGSKNAFDSFLDKFLNMQANEFCTGETISFVGHIEQKDSFQSIEMGKSQIEELDSLITTIITKIIEKGKTPIVIGGGHNNALPIINACFNTTNSKMDVVNLDPHADTRALEGRHSGNSFSYGLVNKWINKYNVLGLHKAYNSQFIINFLKEHNCTFTYFEDYLEEKQDIWKDLIDITESNTDHLLGVELDMDSIAYMPSSAMSPTGWSIEQARKYIQILRKSQRKIAYLHLTEAAPETNEEKLVTGKALAYLVHDFIRP